MGSFAGMVGRPLTTAVAIIVAAADLPDRFPHLKSAITVSTSKSPKDSEFFVTLASVHNFSNPCFASRVTMPLAKINYSFSNNNHPCTPNSLLNTTSSITCPVNLLPLYRSAKLAEASQREKFAPTTPSSPPEGLYKWHLPESNPHDASPKSHTVVVLLGWLGAKQKHLKKYADWYTSKGFHAITFTFPMSDIISYKVGGKAEQNIDLLANHLSNWLEGENGKNLIFHTFSNTGWLTYGAILEKFQMLDSSLITSIKGCIVDSAPVASPDPQVWASGFSAAFLKKQSIATKGSAGLNALGMDELAGNEVTAEAKPAVAETMLLVVLEKFFGVVLNLPSVNRRLSDVLSLLSSQQPRCPQLYIYSSADRVIPVKSVESFIEVQRRSGHEVRACNFISSPHVDHFRNDPLLYTTQLTSFLEDCVVASRKVT